MTPVEAVSPPSVTPHHYNAGVDMTARRDIDEAIGGAVARVREAAESEIRDLAQALAADAEAAAAEHDAAVAQVRGEAVAAKAEHDAVIARVQGAAAAAKAEHDAVIARVQGEVAAAKAAARAAEAEAVAIGRQSARDAVTRLLDAVQRLDAQSTLTAVLDTLADLAAADAGRAALFVATGGEMRGWRFVGFGPAIGEAQDHAVNGAGAGLLGRAIAEGRTQVLAAGAGAASDADGPPAFAALPAGRAAVAVPVLVGGAPMVAVYADDANAAGGGNPPEKVTRPLWPDVVELLARHAGCRLEALTANRAAELAGRAAQPDTDEPAGETLLDPPPAPEA